MQRGQLVKTQRDVDVDSFTSKTAIGKGGFGRVYRVTGVRDGMTYAMKEVSKARLIYRN